MIKIGANYKSGGCEFTIWAPLAKNMEVKIINDKERYVEMTRDDKGYWRAKVWDIKPGDNYVYRLNGSDERPDPISYFQQDGVHGSSRIIDHNAFKWSDSAWKGIPLEEYIIYEMHPGTFTQEGTFYSAINRLDHLQDLGVTAIEAMPISQFPGARNWGYDGVYPFAVQNSYGGPDAFKSFVDACHKNHIAVILDVVYNHFGPDGNYLSMYGPYFTGKYRTPWGEALNFDGEYSDEVRNYFFQNAIHWIENYHIDALRLDAIHMIYDFSAKHFLEELNDHIKTFAKESGRNIYIIAESDLNDARIIAPKNTGGYNLAAQWSDDFHHSIHTLLTGEQGGYYMDFGKSSDLIDAYNNSFVYGGKYSPHRKRRHGNSALERPASQFVTFLQNHDQTGNRAFGERLSALASFEALKLAAGALLISPNIPMLFMGEEYGEDNPFQYFVSHSDEKLVEAVREGRKSEFASFNWKGELPDPQSEETFKRSIIDIEKKKRGKHKALFEFYKQLIKLRKEESALKNFGRDSVKAQSGMVEKVILLGRTGGVDKLLAFMNFNKEQTKININTTGKWKLILDSSAKEWMGNGGALSNTINEQTKELILNGESIIIFKAEG